MNQLENMEEIDIYTEVNERVDLTDIEKAIKAHALNRYRDRLESEIATVDTLINHVCSLRGVSRQALLGGTRKRNMVETRQIIWFLLRERVVNKKITLSELGKIFNRDHATALYGIGNIEKLLSIDSEIREVVMMTANYFGRTTNWDNNNKILTISKEWQDA
tara:strand:+ start:93 stop:578 length:486 start_codon:yes stop_codon:yes gene_type:complete